MMGRPNVPPPVALQDDEFAEPVVSPPVLIPLMAVGISDIPGAVQLVGKDAVVYAYGRCVCLYSTNRALGARMSEPLQSVRSITCIEASPDRTLVAAGEQRMSELSPSGEPIRTEPPVVALFQMPNLERVGTLRGEGVALKYVSLCFTRDGQLLVGAGYSEDLQTTVYHIWDMKQGGATPMDTGSIRGCMRKMGLDPKFHNCMMMYSADEVLSYRRHSGGFREQPVGGLPAQGSCTYVDHVWLPEGGSVVATSQREVLVVNLIANTVSEVIKVDGVITALAVMLDGSLLVAQQLGLITLLRRRTEAELFLKQADLQTPDNPQSTSLNIQINHMSPLDAEDRVAVFIKSGPVYIVNMRLPKTSMFNSANAHDVWDQILPNFHEASIISCSVAVKRDYIATASTDLTVRLWQFFPLRLIITHMCHVAPMAIAIDPWAQNVVVTYPDGCRYYSIVEGMLLEIGELSTEQHGRKLSVEKVSIVRFNPSGSLLAVVEGTEGRLIHIFNTLHIKQLATLAGHHQRVQDLSWSDDGFFLCSSSAGQVFTWQMDGYLCVREETSKGYENDSICCTADFSHLVVGDQLQGLRLMATLRQEGTGAARARALSRQTNAIAAAAASQPESPTPVSPTLSMRGGGAGASPSTKSLLPGRQASVMFADNAVSQEEEKPAKKAVVHELPELSVLGTVMVMQPSPGCLAVVDTPSMSAVIGGLVMGRMRVCPLPPTSADNFRESYAHTADISQIVVHAGSQLVFSVDEEGGWIMHALLPAGQLAGAAVAAGVAGRGAAGAARAARSSRSSLGAAGAAAVRVWRPTGLIVPTSRQGEERWSKVATPKASDEARSASQLRLPDTAEASGLPALPVSVTDPMAPFHAAAHAAYRAIQSVLSTSHADEMEIISVRSIDVQLLKESVKEVREKLNKAAAEFEYKAYERERDVTRMFEGEVADLKAALEKLQADYGRLATALEEATEERHNAELAWQAEMAAKLFKQQEVFDSKLSQEIERSNTAEREMARLKAKFGKKLWQMDDERIASEARANGAVQGLQQTIIATKKEASDSIMEARQQMDLETRMDAELNEEEMGRVTGEAQRVVEEKEDKYMQLLSKFTLQTGINNKTIEENARLRVDNEARKRETLRTTEKLRAVEEELHTMHLAWMERDAKQKIQDRVMSDMAHQLQQSELYTALANTRIRELNEEIEPLRLSKAEIQAQVGAMEGASLRALETKHKILHEKGGMAVRLENAFKELKEVKLVAAKREHYFQNFAGQLFRTVHDVDHRQWPSIFGSLYDDFLKGQDKQDWRHYEHGSDNVKRETAGGKKPATTAEFEEQMAELHQQLMHAERMANKMAEAEKRTEQVHQDRINVTTADNVKLMNEINALKRELKAAREGNDRRTQEIRMLKSGGAAAAATASSNGGGGDVTLPPCPSPSSASNPPSPPFRGTPGKPPSRLGDPRRSVSSEATPPPAPAAATSPRAESHQPRSPRLSGTQVTGEPLFESPGPLQPIRRMTSAPIPEEPPQVVNGDMPTGGWWMGDKSPFEVPSNKAILNGDSTLASAPSPSSSRPLGTCASSQGSRPVSLSQQALLTRHELNKRATTAAAGSSPSGGGSTAGGGFVYPATDSGSGGGAPRASTSDMMPHTPGLADGSSGGGRIAWNQRPTSISPGSNGGSVTVGYHRPAPLNLRDGDGPDGGGIGDATSPTLHSSSGGAGPPPGSSGGTGGGGDTGPGWHPGPVSTSGIVSVTSPTGSGSLAPLTGLSATHPRPTTQQSALLSYLQGLQGQLRAGQQSGAFQPRATTLGAGFRTFNGGGAPKFG